MTYKQVLRARAKKNNRAKALPKFGPYQIILAPLYTEKTVKQGEELQKYSFKVHGDANKIDVKKAIEFIYGVDVVKVNVLVVPHKGRAMRKTVRRSYKKAIITLKKDQKIELV